MLRGRGLRFVFEALETGQDGGMALLVGADDFCQSERVEDLDQPTVGEATLMHGPRESANLLSFIKRLEDDPMARKRELVIDGYNVIKVLRQLGVSFEEIAALGCQLRESPS